MIDWKKITSLFLKNNEHDVRFKCKKLVKKVITISSKYHLIHESFQTMELDDLSGVTIANFHTLSLKQTHSRKSRHLPISNPASDTFWYGSRAARFSCEIFLFRAWKSDLPGAIWTEFAKVENYRRLEPIRVDPKSSSPQHSSCF